MAQLFIALCLVLLASSTSLGCLKSYDCGSGMCCRDTSGHIISDQEHGGFGPLQPINSHQHGTCTTMKAQKGEVCDSSCDCDTGLTCYRQVSGVCCQPRTCFDEAYVKQQQAYWANCMRDPSCGLPP